MTRKRMTRLPAAPEAEQWTGPVLVRGWLRLREPWRHPIAAMRLLGIWRRLRRDVERGPGFVSFEYWLRWEHLLFGMHVGWNSHRELLDFYRTPSHHDAAAFSMRSPFVRGMKFRTLGLDGDRIVQLGGFVIVADESDLAPDSLFPAEQ